MTVETLDQMMTYVIEAWMLLSGTYLTIGFTTSLIQRMREGRKTEVTTALEEAVTEAVEETVAEEVPQAETDRLAEVAAVSEKYTKTTETESVQASVSVSENS
ncbi:MAG: hypothetical protein AAFV72_03725 [Cyanobacteria bacterium J06635_1]